MLYDNLHLKQNPRGGVGVRDISRLRGADNKRSPISFQALLPKTSEMQELPTAQARRAYSRGCEQFGRRFYLVRKGEEYYAIEDLRDKPGWERVMEVRRT